MCVLFIDGVLRAVQDSPICRRHANVLFGDMLPPRPWLSNADSINFFNRFKSYLWAAEVDTVWQIGLADISAGKGPSNCPASPEAARQSEGQNFEYATIRCDSYTWYQTFACPCHDLYVLRCWHKAVRDCFYLHQKMLQHMCCLLICKAMQCSLAECFAKTVLWCI